jgi:hypothetical protein
MTDISTIFPESVAWDGNYLWALANNIIYQLDISEVRAYVVEQSRLHPQKTAKTEMLIPDP